MNTLRIELLINNQEVRGHSYREVMDPGRTSDLVGQVAQASVEQVDQTVTAAHAAFPGWRRTPLPERICLLREVASLLDEEAPKVAELMALKSGMSIPTCQAKVHTAARIVRDNADMATEFLVPWPARCCEVNDSGVMSHHSGH
jgi:succinate-semialdehyde dehydrogenase/glutarate-semialdehyde dehydrogenase